MNLFGGMGKETQYQFKWSLSDKAMNSFAHFFLMF